MNGKPILFERYMELEALLHRYYGRGSHKNAHPKRGQSRVLSILKLQPEISQKELSFMLDMRKQSLGEVLAKLEHKGYITRTPSEADQRAMNICLTDAGKDAAERLDMDMQRKSDIFNILAEEERLQFEGCLNRLIEAIQKEIGQSPECGHHSSSHRCRGHHGHGYRQEGNPPCKHQGDAEKGSR